MTKQAVLHCPKCKLFVRATGGLCARCATRLEPVEGRAAGWAQPPPDAPRSSRKRVQRGPDAGSVGEGIAVALGLHFIGQILIAVIGRDSAEAAFLFIGVTQLTYIVPAMILYGIFGKGRTVAGLALAAAITFGLNALCFGIVCGGM